MTQSDILDVLIGAIILLVALIGLWQGIVRTLLYLCGAFLGSELALWWADDIGDRLADWLPLATGTGRFVASTAMIIATMVIMGACFGTLIWRYPNDWRNRAGGLISGLVLGVLTIGLVLRYYFLFHPTSADAAIGDTNLAWRLWDDFNVIVAISAIALLVMVIAGWVIGPVDQELAAVSTDSGRLGSQSSPVQHETPRPQFTELQAQAAPGEPSLAGRPVQSRGLEESLFAAPSTNGPPQPEPTVAPSPSTFDGRAVRSEGSDPFRGDPEFAPHRASATETVTFSTEGNDERRESAGICPNCGMLLKPGDAYCPNCGFPVES